MNGNLPISRPIRRTVIFSLEILVKNDDECILILVIYCKKTGLLQTKISNHNIIYSSQKPRKLSSLPLKSSSWLFSLNAGMGIYKFGNNTYPRHIRRRSNLGHFFGEKSASYGPGIMVYIYIYSIAFCLPGDNSEQTTCWRLYNVNNRICNMK